ncbi:threonine synthase, partial [Cystoisospora suis]
MGAPIGALLLATNTNDFLVRLHRTGVYQGTRMPLATCSPSMDIAAASNFERLLHMRRAAPSEEDIAGRQRESADQERSAGDACLPPRDVQLHVLRPAESGQPEGTAIAVEPPPPPSLSTSDSKSAGCERSPGQSSQAGSRIG